MPTANSSTKIPLKRSSESIRPAYQPYTQIIPNPLALNVTREGRRLRVRDLLLFCANADRPKGRPLQNQRRRRDTLHWTEAGLTRTDAAGGLRAGHLKSS